MVHKINVHLQTNIMINTIKYSFINIKEAYLVMGIFNIPITIS